MSDLTWDCSRDLYGTQPEMSLPSTPVNPRILVPDTQDDRQQGTRNNSSVHDEEEDSDSGSQQPLLLQQS
ncbi:hypothetical protein Y1Q_0015029 [Alligator mississippiensis]|uniref:Uncharacterized protein n=1 Tax=Alligator mississippiensis TaxID=8496 RepID=A0A151N938_ALLMI|nr:hypothetical protein Y1Q_0015029 [Alligator mississippiensis]